MKRSLIIFSTISLIFSGVSCITSGQEALHYNEVIEEVRSGNTDFAFIKLDDFLQEYPDSRHTPKIKFAIGEYYFQTKNYNSAIQKLTEYIADYPYEKGAVFAKAMLYKTLLEYRKKSPLIETIKESLFSEPLFLIFSESKSKFYVSLLNNSYKIVDYVNRIEIFKNDELLLEIYP